MFYDIMFFYLIIVHHFRPLMREWQMLRNPSNIYGQLRQEITE